jgi:hypothetical protein
LNEECNDAESQTMKGKRCLLFVNDDMPFCKENFSMITVTMHQKTLLEWEAIEIVRKRPLFIIIIVLQLKTN